MPVEFPNLRHLRAFREVAERQSVSAAAEHIHLSQPAVTQAIAGLEKTLDLKLFDRRPEGMFVTPLGAGFLLRVQRLFEFLEEGARAALSGSGRRNRHGHPGFHTRVSSSQLRAFIAIWESGSFSLAARNTGISQPSIHRAGRDLEKLAGVALFAAGAKGIELTKAGESFAHAVKLAAAELQQGLDEITAARGWDSTKIAVGSMPLSRTSILPQAIDALLQSNDGVQVRTVEGPYGELLKGLRYGDLDFLIGALRHPAPTEDIVQEVLLEDPLALVVGPKHPLVGQPHVSLRDTLKFPWIAPPKSTPSGSYLYRALAIEDRDTSPVRIVSSSLVLVRGLLARGQYITVMSRHQMAVEQAQGMMVPLDINLSDSTRPIGITVRRGWRPTLTQEHFLSLVRQAASGSEDHIYT